jgi:hypothetical protein
MPNAKRREKTVITVVFEMFAGDRLTGFELTVKPMQIPEKVALSVELASHTLPIRVFWEAGPSQTNS